MILNDFTLEKLWEKHKANTLNLIPFKDNCQADMYKSNIKTTYLMSAIDLAVAIHLYVTLNPDADIKAKMKEVVEQAEELGSAVLERHNNER